MLADTLPEWNESFGAKRSKKLAIKNACVVVGVVIGHPAQYSESRFYFDSEWQQSQQVPGLPLMKADHARGTGGVCVQILLLRQHPVEMLEGGRNANLLQRPPFRCQHADVAVTVNFDGLRHAGRFLLGDARHVSAAFPLPQCWMC